MARINSTNEPILCTECEETVLMFCQRHQYVPARGESLSYNLLKQTHEMSIN